LGQFPRESAAAGGQYTLNAFTSQAQIARVVIGGYYGSAEITRLTYNNTAPVQGVPEPGTLAMMAIGMAGRWSGPAPAFGSFRLKAEASRELSVSQRVTPISCRGEDAVQPFVREEIPVRSRFSALLVLMAFVLTPAVAQAELVVIDPNA
jgi:hypothetical protein